MKHKENKLAFEYLERSNSRILLELILKNVKSLQKGLMADNELNSLLQEEEEVSGLLSRMQVNQSLSQKDKIEIIRYHERLHSIYEKIEKIDPLYVRIKKGIPVDFEAVQNLISNA